MKRNKGISLIVLVITIIVMIILAGSIILTLNNNGIIDRANEAVKEYNLDEVEQVASLAWAEAYLDGARTQQELETAVKNALTKNKITESEYDGYRLEVTENGIALEKMIAPGLYETGSNYAVLLKDWDTLLNDGEIYLQNGEVSGNGDLNSLAGDLVLPSDGSITSLAQLAFSDTCVTSVVIPDSISVIPNSFVSSYDMSTVYIPGSVTEIQGQAFDQSSLTDIYYKGNKSQWNAIILDEHWNVECYEITIHCTDGTIVFPETIT